MSASRDFAARLDDAGWPVELVELATDHAAIAGAAYDAATDRYDRADDAATRQMAEEVAALIQQAGTRPE